jgi:hypothetical protein
MQRKLLLLQFDMRLILSSAPFPWKLERLYFILFHFFVYYTGPQCFIRNSELRKPLSTERLCYPTISFTTLLITN